MAKRKPKTSVNKSQAIRSYFAENPNAKPKDAAAALVEQGIDVTAAFVSTLRSIDRKKAGDTPRRGRPPGASKSDSGIESLILAKKLVDQMGGVAGAKQVLDSLARILG